MVGRRPDVLITVVALVAAGTVAGGPPAAATRPATRPTPVTQPVARPATRPAVAGSSDPFGRTATYPVYENRAPGEDPGSATVAEISAVSEDGRTLVYTDSPGQRIGFLDISDPYAPRGLGTLPIASADGTRAEPTSVVVAGPYALVVVDTSASSIEPTGRLDVIEVAGRSRVRSFDLGGQPDSIALGKDRRYAAVAIENQRDDTVVPGPGRNAGDLPQPPAGFLQIVDLPTGDPAGWSIRRVPLTAPDGAALPELAAAGIAEPTDPEPEYVSINRKNQIALTLQENNGVVLVDAPTGAIGAAFTAGTVSVSGIDTRTDGTIDQTGSITDVPREPDAVSWVDDRYLATANEGDWHGGSRTWSILDSRNGAVAWDSGDGLPRLAVRHGLHHDGQSGSKGVEPEGVTVAWFNGVRYAFVGTERGSFIAVYDLSRPTRPVFRQVLPTAVGPEGLLAIPGRNLFAVSSEAELPSLGIRACVSLFRWGGPGRDGRALVSADDPAGRPIGWGALSGLSAVPGRPGRLYAVTDAEYRPTRILTIDARREPAVITGELVVTDATGAPVDYDAEGVHARVGGGFWLSVEGAAGSTDALVRLDPDGVVRQTVALPGEAADGPAGQGPHGVTAVTAPAGAHPAGAEQVWVALRQEVPGDPAGTVRLGRFDVRTSGWSWFGYRLHGTATGPAGTGLADLTAVGPDRLAVIERDALAGPAAAVKRIYTVELPTAEPAPGTVPPLATALARDVLPDLRAGHGWTPEKLEGLAVDAAGEFYAVTDNGGMPVAAPETVFLRLGRAGFLRLGRAGRTTGDGR